MSETLVVLPDYEDEDEIQQTPTETQIVPQKAVKGNHASIHSSGFREFLLRPEILRAIADCGFEHPSEVQNECIPQAVIGLDVLCQAKSGTGKTAVFILATLQQMEPTENHVCVLVLCHTRELAFQISGEYKRFSKYLPNVEVDVFFGGMPIQNDVAILRNRRPQVVVGTPGRILDLLRRGYLKLNDLSHFVLDECDKMLELQDLRKDVFEIYRKTPHCKQVMMFSATISNEIRCVCKKFMENPLEVFVDDDSKLTLSSLTQHYVKMEESEKNGKLLELLDVLEFNQVIIFVRSVQRCLMLSKLLEEKEFSAIEIHGCMEQKERLYRYQQFKDFQKRILVSTDLFGRGMDVEGINMVFNYDMSEDSDTYLHRVGRAGRFGTKGMAITFVSEENNAKILNEIQNRFDVNITMLPNEIDLSSYIEGR